jgi:CDP-glycerol glycerophosphotransferase
VIVVYQTFEGRYGDNPAAIYEAWRRRRPHDTHVWLSDEAARPTFPPTVATVPIYTSECRALLEAADVLVANTHTDIDWDKRPDAYYLQTWHGTPLKRIHRDVRWAPAGRLDRLDRDVARWDVLLSPNAPSTPRLRRAFGFTGPVMPTGYPRNDVLNGPAAKRIRRRVRRALGVPDRARAILYAPTWRDDDVFSDATGPGPAAAAVPELLAGLGPDDVLLYRAHSFDVARAAVFAHGQARDVTQHADVAELYLAADLLVTDYSSTMFDFAITGKPLLHFVPDYERFRDEIRGFYFDLAHEAPGPLLRTTADLVAALSDASRLGPAYARRYERFRSRYCALEDGGATARALDLLEAFLAGRETTRTPSLELGLRAP